MTIDVFPAAARHAELVYKIMQAAYAEYAEDVAVPFAAHHETLDDVRAAIAHGGAVLAWYEGVVVGTARYRLESGHFIIERVSVLPGFRGCGVASAMLRTLETTASSYGCTTTELCSRLTLPRNIALYERRGYEIAHACETGRVSMIKRLSQAEEAVPG
jgi:GNAT superfamily N-acetyltransferase